MKRTFRALLLCLSLLYFNLVAVGQTIRTVGTGGDFATLKAAFDAINARSITGAIQLQIISSITDNNSAKLYGSGQVGVITIPAGQGGTGYATGDVVTFSTPEDLNGVAATGRVTAASGAITSIEITDPGSGYAAAPTIASTSGAGTGATPTVIIGGNYTSVDIYPTAANVVLSGAVFGLTGIIDLIGADNVTIDGRENRTGTTTSMTIQNSQAAFTGAFTFKASNDANSNTIRYTRLLSDVSARVELTSNTNGKGVSNFLIENSYISVHANSTIANTQRGISITGNSTNKNITIKNNEFVDLLAKGSEMLFVDNNPDMLTIEGNHFYSTKTNLTLGDNSKFIIRVNSGTNVAIRGNYIGGSAKEIGGAAFKYTNTGSVAAAFWGIYTLDQCPSIVIENNTIGNLELNIQNGALEAIQCSSSNAIIKNNRIGDLNSTNSIITNTGFRGILVPVGPNLTVEQNSIGGVEAIGFANAVSSTSNGGGNILNNIIGKIKLKFNGVSQGLVAIATGSNYNIKGNYIYGCTNENPGFTYGISTNSGNSVINNIIHLQASNTSTVSGVEKSGTGSLTVYNNTVLIDGTSNTGNNNSYSLIENGTGAGDYRNNLLINTAANTGDATGKHYAASLLSAPTTINYNNYYVSGTGGVLGSFNNVDKTTLSAWQASTLQDCFSTSINPNFPTPSGVATANFLPTNLNLVATPIAGITTDYLGTSRDASNPSMGALEYTVTPPAPTTTTASTCGSYTWSVNNQSYTESGTYTYTSGCITYTLNLTITTTPSWYVDGDGDGYVGEAITQCDRPTNGYLESELAGANLQLGDCDDSDATKFASFNFYVDSDGDGFGTGTAVSICAADANTAPAGYSTNSTDCDDTDATKNASFNFYVDSDGDGFGTGSAVSVCAANANTAPTGFSTSNTDCNDNNANINPGKTEVCGNNIDDNCNGQVDEGCAVPCNFKTLTQSGWDATGSSSPLTNSWFAAKFPGGLIIGGTGNCGRFIKLTSAAAVRAMLPSSGVANILSQSWTNPSNKSVKNSLAGELVALTLNIALNPELGNAKIKSGPYMNKTVNWLLAEANLKISSTTSKSAELKSLSDACNKVNCSFGKTKSGYVVCDVYNPSTITSVTNSYSSSILFENVKEDGKPQLKVYPNPSTNYFNIRNNYTHSIQIRVMTLSGKVIEEVKSIQPGHTHQFGHKLIAGIYLVEISENGNSTVQKIIKAG